jgi:hypothetical protein
VRAWQGRAIDFQLLDHMRYRHALGDILDRVLLV